MSRCSIWRRLGIFRKHQKYVRGSTQGNSGRPSSLQKTKHIINYNEINIIGCRRDGPGRNHTRHIKVAEHHGHLAIFTVAGYGLLNDPCATLDATRAMAGVGYAMNSGRQINVMNPASYAAIDSLTFLFDIGMDMSPQWNREGSKHGRDFGGGLDHITMQVPTTNTGASAQACCRSPSVGYAFGGEIDNGNETREGSGGLQPAISRPQRKDSERAHGRRNHIIPVGRK